MTKKEQAAIERIAKEILHLETLETRHGDEFDFHDCAVWNIKEALERAYQLGKEQGK